MPGWTAVPAVGQTDAAVTGLTPAAGQDGHLAARTGVVLRDGVVGTPTPVGDTDPTGRSSSPDATRKASTTTSGPSTDHGTPGLPESHG